MINTDGTLGSFSLSANSLPSAVTGHKTLMTKNTVYVVGGYDGTSMTNKVFKASVNTDGTLGTWSSGTLLPINVANDSLIATKNKVYLIGGYDGANWLTSVYSAVIDVDGAIGAWTSETTLPISLGDSNSIVIGDKAYLIGGFVNGNTSRSVYRYTISETGALTDFSVLKQTFPEPISNANLFIVKDNVYITGYWNGFKTVNNIVTINCPNVGLVDYSEFYSGNINKFDGTNLPLTIVSGTAPTGDLFFKVPDSRFEDKRDNLNSYIKT